MDIESYLWTLRAIYGHWELTGDFYDYSRTLRAIQGLSMVFGSYLWALIAFYELWELFKDLEGYLWT